MLREAGISLRSVILLDSDAQDDSSGALSSCGSSVDAGGIAGTVEVGHWWRPRQTSTSIGRVSRQTWRLRRVGIIWALLFFNVLDPAGGAVLPIPHKVAQLITQGALFLALVLVLTINPRMRIRPNWFLGLYTLLAITSLMMSVRFVGLGTAYRSFRLVGFLFVLWLLTPWWGRRDLLVLRSQMRFLLLVLGSVVLGLLISPGRELGGRLSGMLWPIPPTQVAHFAAELAGLTTLLWFCRLVSGRHALLVVVPALFILVLTHTRTALTALVVGLLVAGTSIFLSRRRVRKTLATALIVHRGHRDSGVAVSRKLAYSRRERPATSEPHWSHAGLVGGALDPSANHQRSLRKRHHKREREQLVEPSDERASH